MGELRRDCPPTWPRVSCSEFAENGSGSTWSVAAVVRAPDHIRAIARPRSKASSRRGKRARTHSGDYAHFSGLEEPLDDSTRKVQLLDGRRAHQRHGFAQVRPPDPRRPTSSTRRSRWRPRTGPQRRGQHHRRQHGRGTCSTPRQAMDALPQAALRPRPDIAKVPIMIDSSKWSVIEAGLQAVFRARVSSTPFQPQGGRGGFFAPSARLIQEATARGSW